MLRSITLSVVAVMIVLVAGCQDESPFTPGDESAGGPQTSSTVVGLGRSAAATVFQDTDSWREWSVSSREQVSSDRGDKWVSFAPSGNRLYSPRFTRTVDEFRVTFDVYLSEDFLDRRPSAPSVLLGFSTRPAGVSTDDRYTKFAIERQANGDWRVRGRSAGDNGLNDWGTGDRFTLGSFEAGWTTVEWTFRDRSGRTNDEMTIDIGGQTRSWRGQNLTAEGEDFAHIVIGDWRDRHGECRFGIRNLRVEDLTGRGDPPHNDPPHNDPPSNDPPNNDPPHNDPPNNDPPHNDPPNNDPPHNDPPHNDPPNNDPPNNTPPLPPSSGDDSAGGPIVQSGFWRGWRVRSVAKFPDRGGYGAMKTNTQGILYIGEDRDGAGEFDVRIRFGSGQLDVPGGGKHLIGIQSYPLIFNSGGQSSATTRVDFNQPEDGKLRATVISRVNGDNRTSSHWFDVPFAVGRWANVTIDWRHSGNNLVLTVNGDSHSFSLLSGSPRIGRYLSAGNMDDIQGEIDFDDLRWSQ